MEGQPHVLVVDDDREIRDLVSRFLRKHGYRVDVAADGTGMREVIARSKIDLVILDRMLPGEDGIELCRFLRKGSRIPIIMLTLLGTEPDRLQGFETGVDDYVVKPFSPQELLARIKAVLRRSNDLPLYSSLQNAATLCFAGWTIDRTRRRLTSPSRTTVTLTDGEFDLLLAFAEHPQVVLSRDELLDLARGRAAHLFDRSVDVQVGRLRRKIESDPENPELIKAVRARGYVFTPDVEEVES